jgi:PPM family protein phosphatase
MNSPPLEFNFHGDAIRGERANQEDCWKVHRLDGASPSGVLAVLSDGMGGHASGEVASELACNHFLQSFTAQNGRIAARLERSLAASNAALGRAILDNADLAGMGCTLVACYVDQEGLHFASVGDSVLLLFRNRKVKRVNQDHSIGALLDKQAEAQIISRTEAVNSPRRRSLRSALTGADIPLKDLSERPIPLLPGDWILIASDGLETLSQDEIAQIMSTVSSGAPHAAVAALLRGVVNKRADNQDNTSVIAVKVADPRDDRILRRVDDDGTTEVLHTEPHRAGNGTGRSRPAMRAVLALLIAAIAVIGVWLLKDELVAAWRPAPGAPAKQRPAVVHPQTAPSNPAPNAEKAAVTPPEHRPPVARQQHPSSPAEQRPGGARQQSTNPEGPPPNQEKSE